MMRFAYPNVQHGQFQACVRYLSLSPDQAPDPPYCLADPKTPDLDVIHGAVQALVPERMEQPVQGQVYEVADTPGPWHGSSLDLAYFLALIRCHRPCEMDAVTDVGDVWCTGKMSSRGNPCPLETGMGLTRDSLVSVMYAEELNSAKSSVTLQRTDRHGILGQKPTDFQVSL